MHDVNCSTDQDTGCAICRDLAEAAVVVAVDWATHTATVTSGETELEVALDLIADVKPGDTVLIQYDFVIARIEE